MPERITGWVFVAVQAVLLITLVALPGADHWPVPPLIGGVSAALIVAGLVIAAVAAVGLGPALTPTPVPNRSGRLATGGLYRYSRHPIYSGVLLIVTGLVVGSGNLVAVAVGLVTAGFFNLKAAWEEQRLARRYPDYAAYAASTSRFGPRPWHRRRRQGGESGR